MLNHLRKLFFALIVSLSAPLVAEVKVLAFSGSTRADSSNKKLLNDAVILARQMGAKVTVIDLKDYPMPIYNGDEEENQGMPKNAKRLRELMINTDAILIASPEYNSSLSPLLKNALDWTSRGENGDASRKAFKNKKFAIMSASPGSGGGVRGLVHLRAIIEAIGGTVLAQQVSIPRAHEYFADQPRAVHTALKEEIQALLRS